VQQSMIVGKVPPVVVDLRQAGAAGMTSMTGSAARGAGA
jgi:hypothetical protein